MKKAFTLLELVVVLTIVSVLSVVGLASYSSYAISSRDSARVMDLKNITKTLEYYAIEHNNYPLPTDSVAVTFAWVTIWDQWTIGQSVQEKLQRLTSIPVDPLTGNQYAYSVTQDKMHYQLGTLAEWGTPVVFTSQTFADNKTASAVIEGNYNNPTIHVKTSGMNYALALPSILNGDMSYTDINDIIDNGTLVLPGAKNLPANYKEAGYNTLAGWDVAGIKLEDFVVYSWLDINMNMSWAEKKDFLKSLQEAYSIMPGSAQNYKIQRLMNLNLEDSSSVEQYFESVILKRED